MKNTPGFEGYSSMLAAYKAFDNVPFAVSFLKAEDLVIEYLNRYSLELWQQKREEVIGKPLFDVRPQLRSTLSRLFEKVQQTGKRFTEYEVPVQARTEKGMETRYFDVIVDPVSLDSNNIIGHLTTSFDVTEQVIARKKIEDSAFENSRLAAIVQSSDDAIISKTLEGIVTSWNPAAQKLFGYTAEEMIGQPIIKLFPADRLSEETDILQRIRNGQTVEHFQTKRIAKNGTVLDISLTISPIKDSEGRIIGASKIARDITEELKGNEALRLSEARFRMLFNTMDEGFCVIEFLDGPHGELSDYIHISANPAYSINAGIPDIVGKKARDIVPEEADEWVSIYREVLLTGQAIRFERELVATGRYLELAAFRIEPPGLKQVAVIFKDITERKRAEERQAYLLKLNDAIQPLSDATAIKATALEVLGKYLRIDRAMYTEVDLRDESYVITDNYVAEGVPKILGRFPLSSFGSIFDNFRQSKNLVLNNAFTDNFDDTERKNLLAINVIAALAIPIVKDNVLVGILSAHQLRPRTWTLWEISAMQDTAERTWAIVERAIAEEKLAISERQLSELANAVPQLVWIANAEGEVHYYNDRIAEFAGAKRVGNKWRWEGLIHPDDIQSTTEAWKNAVASKSNYDQEHRIKLKDGSYKWFLSRAYPQKNEQGQIVQWHGTATLIDEQKEFAKTLEKKVEERTLELKEKNIELEKMNKELESFTYISSHDLQEPLRKIRVFAGRIMEKESDKLSDEAKEYFMKMNNAAVRMQTLIQDLLAFSRLSTTERRFELTDLKKLFEEVKSEFSDSLEEKNAIVDAGSLCELNVIPFQFRQLFHNLLSNSLKFAKSDTPLSVSIRSETVMQRIPNASEERPVCHIIYADNGIGFEPEFSEKVFEVFQKLHGQDEYKGTGIGLSIVKKIVEIHNGQITATSELGKGVSFSIYLPV